MVFIYLYFGNVGATSFQRTLPIPISVNLFADGSAYGGTDGSVSAVYNARIAMINYTTVQGICYAIPSSGGVITADCGFRAFVLGKI